MIYRGETVAEGEVIPDQSVHIKKKSYVWLFVLIAVLAVLAIAICVVIVSSFVARKTSQDILSRMQQEMQQEMPQQMQQEMPQQMPQQMPPDAPDQGGGDFSDLPGMEDFPDFSGQRSEPGTYTDPQDGQDGSSGIRSGAGQPGVDRSDYSYTEVTTDGSDITIVPNGGMNGSTVLASGKDLEGLLDYIDAEVLEKGRTINRDLFYELLATMLVDKDLAGGYERIEKNVVMALAMANNFHDTDVTVNECTLDANNAAEYHYKVTQYGTDDTWIVNYQRRTIYLNNGATEYVSDMFRDENLAVLATAVGIYYDKL